MNIPLEVMECRNVRKDEEHKVKIDSYICELLQFINESAFETLPVRELSKKQGNDKSKRSMSSRIKTRQGSGIRYG